MQLRAAGPDVWYADESLGFVGPDEIAFLKENARSSRRLRARICLHESVGSPVQEMVISHHRSCYVRPHRHAKKCESLTILEGAAVAVFFDDAANITATRALDAAAGPIICRVPKNVWHGLVIASEWLVFYEVSAGPFGPGSSEFPDWAPEEFASTAGPFLDALRLRVAGAI
jgi:cupin fold WbuC family metalloprotein